MSRKKLLMATVAVISSASAGAAFGQTVSNQAFIGQLDQSNLAYLSQVGTQPRLRLPVWQWQLLPAVPQWSAFRCAGRIQ
jgi:hypothetical protein